MPAVVQVAPAVPVVSRLSSRSACSRESRRLAAFALAGLLAVYAWLAVSFAVPGSRVVPAAGVDGPAWLFGPFRFVDLGVAGGSDAPLWFFLGLVLAFLLWVTVWALSGALGRRATIGVTLAAIVLFALAPPLFSQDVFSYLAYARIGALHHLNPYVASPAAIAADPVFGYVGWVGTPSTYGAVFTLLSYSSAVLSPAVALWATKAVVALAVVGVLALVWRIAEIRGGDPQRAIVLVGLNPLVLVHVIGGAHNDALAILVAVAGVYLAVAGRSTWSGVAATVAAAIKVSVAPVGVFSILGTRHRGRAFAGALAAAALVAAVSIAAFGRHSVDAIGLLGETQQHASFYSVPSRLTWLVSSAFGFPAQDISGVVRGVFAGVGVAVAVVLLGLAWVRKGDWIALAGWTTVAVLVATAWLMPWYVLWLLPLASVAAGKRLPATAIVLTAYMLPARIGI